jgi:hypothetical protein
VLWKFRWYSLINQLLIWTVTALVFGTCSSGTSPRRNPKADAETAEREPAGAAS